MQEAQTHDPHESTSKILRNYLVPGDTANDERWTDANKCLRSIGYKFDVGVALTSAGYAEVRLRLIQHLLSKR
jgi:hypothetical protein